MVHGGWWMVIGDILHHEYAMNFAIINTLYIKSFYNCITNALENDLMKEGNTSGISLSVGIRWEVPLFL